VEPHELEALRARIHKLADQVQAHEVKMGEHGVLITVLNENYQRAATKDNLEAAMAGTKQHIESSIASTKQHIEASVAGVSAEVRSLEDKLTPIQRGIYWVIGTVLAAVILALLGLIFKGIA